MCSVPVYYYFLWNIAKIFLLFLSFLNSTHAKVHLAVCVVQTIQKCSSYPNLTLELHLHHAVVLPLLHLANPNITEKSSRNSSNLSQDLTQFEICKADATQIEIDCRSQVNRSFIVRVETPTMEVGTMHFSAAGTTHMFTPNKGGCGHGVWRFSVYTVEDGHETVHSEKTMNLDGVGILFFRIIDDLEICLERQEFLHIAHCHTRKH
ncbi:unnamed protein product [Caenorhabditis angaria]|uniref:Uncharacterized protein n=1 Tax=Caenorhabditis angaria TaxID=860376 RepID=A0A9P1N849_9PELO|nr:unnamed protein product [Caenorhabditis angaria]